MRTLPPSYVADFDSASACLRATARVLKGKDFPSWGLARPLKRIVPLANLFGPEVRETIYAIGGMMEGISPRSTGKVRAERLARWATGLYPARRYPGVMIGSSNGALVHLCAALGMPWLPQTLFVPVRQLGIHPDEPAEDMEASLEPGRRLLEANPELQLHHMHDPNQDRLMVEHMTYFRIKRLRLGEAYEEFLRRTLPPGGPIILVECERRWPVKRLGERHLFQFGALGGATEEEFHHGSPRVAEYLERYGARRRQWDPPEPDEEAPEAEWGFAPELREDTLRFAREHGYRVVRLVFEEPEALSPLVADFYRWWYEQRRIQARRLFVESFIMIEPWWTLRTGSVPFWMKFNTETSFDALSAYLERSEPFDEIYLTLFQQGTEGVGLPSIEQWRTLLRHARRRGEFLGIEPEEHPRDFGGLGRYQDAVQEIPARYPIPSRLPLAQLARFVDERAGQYEVEWHGLGQATQALPRAA